MKNLLKAVTWITGLLGGLGISMGIVKIGEWILSKIFDDEGVFAETHPFITILICCIYIAVSAFVPFWLITEVIYKVCDKICSAIDKKFDKHVEMAETEDDGDLEWL